MKRRIIALAAAGLLATLGLQYNIEASASGACPYADASDCVPPSSTTAYKYTHSKDFAGPSVDNNGYGWDQDSVAAGQTTSLENHEVPVTDKDTDPDGSGKLAKKCYVDSDADNVKDFVPDDRSAAWVTWRYVKVHAEFIFRWCMRPISSTEYHYWYTPQTLFASFEMAQEDWVGEVPRFWCNIFKRFVIDGFVRDGSGKSQDVQSFTIPCVTGWFGNSSYYTIPLLSRKKFHYDLDYGYPKWTATVKDVNDPDGTGPLGFPDIYFDDLNGRLNPN